MANYLALNPPRPRRGGLQRGEGVPRGDGLDRVGPDAPAAVRARGRLLRRARALGRAAPAGRHVRPGARRRAASSRSSRSPRRGAHERPRPVAADAAPHAPALRRRGHARGRVAGALPRPAREPRAGRQHARGAGERPRRAAGRARLGGQALLGDAPGADPRADGDAPSRRGRRKGRTSQLLRLHARHRPDRAVDAGRRRAARHERRGPLAALQRQAAAQEARLQHGLLQHLRERGRRPLAADRRQPPRGAAPLRPQATTAASSATSRTATRSRCAASGT